MKQHGLTLLSAFLRWFGRITPKMENLQPPSLQSLAAALSVVGQAGLNLAVVLTGLTLRCNGSSISE
jgi:hypothetical protein